MERKWHLEGMNMASFTGSRNTECRKKRGLSRDYRDGQDRAYRAL